MKTKSLFFNIVLSSFGVTFFYEPPATEMLSPATGLDWQPVNSEAISKRETIDNFFIIYLILSERYARSNNRDKREQVAERRVTGRITTLLGSL